MPREGTKTITAVLSTEKFEIEIRYAPGGDENYTYLLFSTLVYIEIRYAPGGDEN